MSEVMKHILYGGPLPTNIYDGAQSLGEYCLQNLRLNGDEVLIVNSETLEEITASQLLARSIKVAECLLHYGLKPGDMIGICSENQMQYCYVVFGSFFIGVTVAPICKTLTEDELKHIINISEPNVIFTSLNTVEIVANVAEKCLFIKHIVVFGDKSVDERYKSFKDFVNNPEIVFTNSIDCKPQVMESKVAVILCSSGTTGLSKCVELTEKNILNELARDKMFKEGYLLCVASFSHGTGLLIMMQSTLSSTKTIFLPRHDDDIFLRCIEKFKIKYLSLNPTILTMLASSLLVSKYDLSGLKFISSTGLALSPKIITAVQIRLPGVIIYQSYGSTETLAILRQNNNFNTLGSIGILLPGSWGKVIDPESGVNLGPNLKGELLFKADTMFKGYMKNSKATRDAIDNDGFYKSGDIGYYNEKNEWFFVSRSKELIKYKAYHVPPIELETLLMSHPNVYDACVIGLPDENSGELPLGFIVKIGEVTDIELINFVAERISDPKHLRGGVRFISKIPRNSNGKILRRKLLGEITQ